MSTTDSKVAAKDSEEQIKKGTKRSAEVSFFIYIFLLGFCLMFAVGSRAYIVLKILD